MNAMEEITGFVPSPSLLPRCHWDAAGAAGRLVHFASNHDTAATTTTTTTSNTNDELVLLQQVKDSVKELKQILFREYTSFFDPMYPEWYAYDVTFNDPLNSLQGVDKYRQNVDMLGGRSLFGKWLFSDASIVLHSVSGGEVSLSSSSSSSDDNGNDNCSVVTISEMRSRWTLRFTFQPLPWKPTARFTGVSTYKVVVASPTDTTTNTAARVQIVSQQDYWDSINLKEDGSGTYQTMDRGVGVQDFLNQVKPSGLEAKQSGPELPYQLLRRGNGYEVRRYPAFAAVRLPYSRRDEGYGSLGAFTRGMNPLAPSIMNVYDDETANKYMSWPIAFQPPGTKSQLVVPPRAEEQAGQGQWRTMKLDKTPSRVVAVMEFNDASMGPVVRLADRELRQVLARDGLVPADGTDDQVMFAQYDAVYSMGKRRGEAWIPLKDDGVW